MLSWDPSLGCTIGSIHTSPVNQSAGPFTVGGLDSSPMSMLLLSGDSSIRPARIAAMTPPQGVQLRYAGATLWLSRNRLPGSYVDLRPARRPWFGPYADLT